MNALHGFKLQSEILADEQAERGLETGEAEGREEKHRDEDADAGPLQRGHHARESRAWGGRFRAGLPALRKFGEGENKIQIEYVNSGGQKTEMSVLVTSRRI